MADRKRKKAAWMTPDEQAAYDERTRYLNEVRDRLWADLQHRRALERRRAERWARLKRLVRAA